jgi:hypothetical protein
VAFERPELDATGIESYFTEAVASHVDVDVTTLEFVIRKRLEKEAKQFAEQLDRVENAHKLRQFVDLIVSAFPSGLVGGAEYFVWSADPVLQRRQRGPSPKGAKR